MLCLVASQCLDVPSDVTFDRGGGSISRLEVDREAEVAKDTVCGALRLYLFDLGLALLGGILCRGSRHGCLFFDLVHESHEHLSQLVPNTHDTQCLTTLHVRLVASVVNRSAREEVARDSGISALLGRRRAKR